MSASTDMVCDATCVSRLVPYRQRLVREAAREKRGAAPSHMRRALLLQEELSYLRLLSRFQFYVGKQPSILRFWGIALLLKMTSIVLPDDCCCAEYYSYPCEPYTGGRGQRASTTVEIPPRGRKSPFTWAHTGWQALTTSSSTWLTTFS